MALRSKQGYLELHKGRGKWKSYMFKVTGSTYFHYFGDKKMTSPKDQLLLSQVKSVGVTSQPPKGGKFVFEIKGIKGAHWIINAASYEDMLQWMEAIQPHSTRAIARQLPSKPAATIDTPTVPVAMVTQTLPPVRTTVPVAMVTQTLPPVRTTVPVAMVTQTLPSVMETPTTNGHKADLTRSLVQHFSDNQLDKSHAPSTPPPQPEPAVNKPKPLPRQPHTLIKKKYPSADLDHTPISHTLSKPTTSPTSSVPTHLYYTLEEKCPNTFQGADFSAYIEPSALNMPPTPVTASTNDHTPPVSPPMEEYMVMSPTRKVSVPTQEYMVLMSNSSRGNENETSGGNGDQSKVREVTEKEREVMDALGQRFTTDQLELLLDMLKKMKGNEEGGNPETSLHTQDLGYLVQKSTVTLTDKFLVTTEDDPSSYDKRPSWAKAVNEDDDPTHVNTSQFQIETDAYNIPESEIMNMSSIGYGQFGEVFKAQYLPGRDAGKSVMVAVKTTKKDSTDKENAELLREMAVMSYMVHPNIVKLYGVVTVNVPAPWIILEYLPYGDLKKFLQKSPKKSSDTLIKYMVDVAMGMHYIADRGLIHRDLAARNILVGEGELCKVADFGLLRELPQDDSIYYSTNNVPCPIRWMSPEAISRRKFSIASDVWSFGILMWEIFNPSRTPYEGMDNLQVAMKVNEGYRLPTPRGCPSVVSRLMKSCWHTDVLKRPSFLLIATLLTSKVSSTPSSIVK